MGDQSEIDYLIRRAGQELDQAEASRDPIIAHIHRQMAGAYAAQVAKLRLLMPRVMEARNLMAYSSTSMR